MAQDVDGTFGARGVGDGRGEHAGSLAQGGRRRSRDVVKDGSDALRCEARGQAALHMLEVVVACQLPKPEHAGHEVDAVARLGHSAPGERPGSAKPISRATEKSKRTSTIEVSPGAALASARTRCRESVPFAPLWVAPPRARAASASESVPKPSASLNVQV